MMIRRSLIAFSVLLVAAGWESVPACVCGGQQSPCEAYGSVSAVFIGYVRKTEPDATGTGEQVAYVTVEKAFKGITDFEAVFRQPSSDCDPQFRTGERWLFYAAYVPKTRNWQVGGCGRSSRIEFASDDLLYLDKLAESSARTRISGTVKHYEDAPKTGFTLLGAIPATKVRIVGDSQTYEVFTDTNGVYEIYDLRPGNYRIEPEIPAGLALRFAMPFGHLVAERPSVTIELRESGCAGADFLLSSSSSIAGTILGHNGTLLKDACVELAPAEGPANSYFRIFSCTKEDGRYELRQIPPGRYVVILNKDGKPTGRQPFPALYYPGVLDRGSAAVITISQGENLEGMDIHVVGELTTHRIQGVLLFPDGQPAAREVVLFKPERKNGEYDRGASSFTDDQGRFSLTVLDGSRGAIQGTFLAYGSKVYGSKYYDCPQLRELLKKDGMLAQVQTEPVLIEVNEDRQDIKLTLPIPCQKKKRN